MFQWSKVELVLEKEYEILFPKIDRYVNHDFI